MLILAFTGIFGVTCLPLGLLLLDLEEPFEFLCFLSLLLLLLSFFYSFFLPIVDTFTGIFAMSPY
jgi:hypothetical protein